MANTRLQLRLNGGHHHAHEGAPSRHRGKRKLLGSLLPTRLVCNATYERLPVCGSGIDLSHGTARAKLHLAFRQLLL